MYLLLLLLFALRTLSSQVIIEDELHDGYVFQITPLTSLTPAQQELHHLQLFHKQQRLSHLGGPSSQLPRAPKRKNSRLFRLGLRRLHRLAQLPLRLQFCRRLPTP